MQENKLNKPNKDFESWHKIKKDIESNLKSKWLRPREVWWVSLGVNVGVEEDGKGVNFLRPVLVLKVFGADSALTVSLTSKKKIGKFYFEVGKVGETQEISIAIISQVRILDTKRFVEKVGKLDGEIFTQVKKSITDLLL